jgi:hypothetical protein
MSYSKEEEQQESYQEFQDQVKQLEVLVKNLKGETNIYFIKNVWSELKTRVQYIGLNYIEKM